MANKKTLASMRGAVIIVLAAVMVGAVILPFASGCGGDKPAETGASGTVPTPSTPKPDAAPRPVVPVKEYGWEIVKTYPHDAKAYTQGLEFNGGSMLESTGLYGSSSLREVSLASGRVDRKVDVGAEYFGEGMTLLKGRIYMLTWRNGVGFIFDPMTFNRVGVFNYQGEGWGLTNNGQYLIMSDGTNRLRFIDPATLAQTGYVDVFDRGVPVPQLNELEFINGEVFANVYQTDTIVRIDPSNGNVVGRIDLKGLLPEADRAAGAEVLNGIAFDKSNDRLFVTGKLWPKLFEIRLKPKEVMAQR